MNEAGVIVRRMYSVNTTSPFVKHDKFKLLLETKAPYDVPN